MPQTVEVSPPKLKIMRLCPLVFDGHILKLHKPVLLQSLNVCVVKEQNVKLFLCILFFAFLGDIGGCSPCSLVQEHCVGQPAVGCSASLWFSS